MINFLIESNVSLVALLAFYHLFLEREKIHQFNRFYLLISLVISLIIPFIKIELIKEVETVFIALNSKESINKDAIIPENETVNYFPILLLSLYVIVALILFARFLKNIYSFKKTIKYNEKVSFKKATLVLLNEKIIPHTFLNYIFLNKESYNNRTIEIELYQHELTHVNQKHTYDILGIELLKIIFWFNPIFYFYKKAIQLNHEFIADENVVKAHTNIPFYQSLLLKTNDNTNYYLASNLNYLITKKRLIMMTKTTSKFSGFIKKAGIIPLLTFIIHFLCTDLVAQEKVKSNPEFPNKELDTYYGDTRVIIKDKDGKIITDKKYPELSEKEKMQVPPPPPKPSKISISETQFEDFKNQTKYAIWIDGVHVKNSELNKYKNSDFVHFINSHVYKNARSKKFPQENQASLYTEKGFIEAFEKKKESFGGTIEIRKTENVVNQKAEMYIENLYEKGKKSNSNIKVRPTTFDETEKENIIKVDKLSDFDTKDKKEGYIYMNNGTYFFSKNEMGEIEYFNRWGNLVNEKGEKIEQTKEKK